jgi:hypothetical protein
LTANISKKILNKGDEYEMRAVALVLDEGLLCPLWWRGTQAVQATHICK